jgi:hypothetical protein
MFSPLGSRAVRATSVAVFLAGCVLPASAKTTVIRELGTAPLLGESSSTNEMRDRVEKNQTVLREAALKSGLTAAQYQQVNEAIAASRVQWVTVPRHLTVMTWRSGVNVYVIHDVKIPPRVNGWEVDLKERHDTLAVYLPAKCGNLSYVRRPRQDVAVVPHPRAPQAVAAVVPVAAPAPVPAVVAAPAAAPAAPAAAPAAPSAARYSPIAGIVAFGGLIAGGIASVGGGVTSAVGGLESIGGGGGGGAGGGACGV